MKKKLLALADLKDHTEKQIKEHLARGYSGVSDSGDSAGDSDSVMSKLKGLSVLIAYESVGDYGCDSSSYFLLKDKKGKLFEVHGSHCSCYGFEGQFQLEETNLKALKDRVSKAELFSTGGYDESPSENENISKEFVLKLK